MNWRKNVRSLGFEWLRAYLGKREVSDDSSRRVTVDSAAPVKAELNIAVELHQAGKLDEAEAIYRKILQQWPNDSDALHFLGVVQAQRGDFQGAVDLIGNAVQINGNNAAALLNLGNALKSLKRGDAALACYERSLAVNPGSAEAHNSRGTILSEQGNHIEAIASFEQALAILPTHVDANFNRAVSLLVLHRLQESLAGFDGVLQVEPNHLSALQSRGAVLAALGRHEEALVSYDRALAIRPDFLGALIGRCAALMVLRQFDAALAGYERVLTLSPGWLEALFNCGLALIELKRYAEAVLIYDQVLAIKPDFAEAHLNRGWASGLAGDYMRALESYDFALAIRPDYAEALFNRGVSLALVNRKAEAIDSYERAIALDPRHVGALNNCGLLLMEMKQYDHALTSFDRALAISTDSVDVLASRGAVLRALDLHDRAAEDFSRVIELDQARAYALGNKFNSDLHSCNWGSYRVDRERLFEAVRDGRLASFPFSFLVMSDSPVDQLRCAKTYVADKYPAAAIPLWSGERYRHKKIRLAYLSADFHGHATSYLMAELFEKHNRGKFEVVAWSFGPDSKGEMRERLRTSFDEFHDVRHLSDIEVARVLREREVDIAVDLKGYTKDSRTGIFSHRAVPIQVNYLVYPGTMGANYIDYIVGDSVVIPQGHEDYYAEKVVRLPDTYQVNDSRRVISEQTPSRSECMLPQSGFVFCCFNKNYKISPEIFDIWMRLLKSVEGSVLWLFEDNAAASRNLRAAAQARGVRADRLVFAAHMSLPDHLARHRLADLFLDTLPCNAHTTTSDALWAGLPVLTCLGNSFPGRVAASLLRAIGLPELITQNLTEYEALALKLATTPVLLNNIRAKLARNRVTYPLFDIDRCRRHLEDAYITMYERHMRGEPPESFSVQPIS